jgi:alpha-ketoglutarate-dependent dioxygenase alkB family protein 2
MTTKYATVSDIECVEYYPNFLPDEISKNVLNNIMKEAEFLSDEKSAIVIFGKKTIIPRKQCGYGDEGTSYKFTGVNVEGKTWNDVPILNNIKEYIHKKLNVPVNFVLVNLYRDGNDYIGYHSDDEKDLDNKYPIVSLSFGAERTFLLKHKITGKTHEKLLNNNSCIIMKPPCQSLYKHSVPKRTKIKNSRINLTFRVIK